MKNMVDAMKPESMTVSRMGPTVFVQDDEAALSPSRFKMVRVGS